MEKQLTDFSHELPAPFTYRMTQLLGDESENFFNALRTPSPTSVRLNPEKILLPKSLPFPAELQSQVPWCEQAFYLKQRPLFTLDPCFHAGAYYVQEASSMFLQFILKQIYHQTPLRALDLCAAPGGKTTLLASMLSPDSLLVANEVIKSRANILKENVIKWGHHNIVVTNSDPRQFSTLKGAFDLLLVDAPCSGEGMFRKEETAVTDWSMETVQMCARRQAEILDSGAALVRPGGRLVYSTCTFSPEENEDTIAAFLQRHPEFEADPVENIWFEAGENATYRMWPHKLRGEGHFAAVLRKTGGEEGDAPLISGGKLTKEWENFAKELKIELPDGKAVLFGSSLYWVPVQMPDIRRIKVVRPGLELGEIKKNRFEPAHALALWLKKCENIQDFPAQSQEIRAFMEGQVIPGTVHGWCLITADGYSIGWGKGDGKTIKNHYPKGLRRNS